MTSTGADGKTYEMTFIDRRTFTLWLATIDTGRHLWFAASDLARALGLRDGYTLTRSAHEEDKKFLEVATGGGRQRGAVISDVGLIVFASRSLRPSGRGLLLWVLDELTS